MKCYWGLILVLAVLSLNGCTGKQEYESQLKSANIKISELQKQVDLLKRDLENQKLTSTTKNESLSVRVVGVDEKNLKYILTSPKRNAQSVSIIGSNINGLVEDYEEIVWKVDNSGSFFKAEVTGSIFDFQLINVKWDEKSSKFVEGEVIKELKELRNTTLYIEEDLPCGLPLNKIKWKDENKKEHEVYLGNDGYGFSGTVIWDR